MSDTLAQICDRKRAHVATRKAMMPLPLVESLARGQPEPRGFVKAIKRTLAKGDYALICEIKKASPSKGLIRADFDPPALARAYEAGGATCLSVLTDEPYFQGHDSYLMAARAAVDLPVLRKDFMIDPYQVVEARAIGADCILLILAALDDVVAAELEAAARDWGMDVLIEVHNYAELDRAHKLKSPLIGMNNRNLKTLKVNLKTSHELAPMIKKGRIAVGESGFSTKADLDRLAKAGVKTFLIGEALMRQDNVTAATRALLGKRV